MQSRDGDRTWIDRVEQGPYDTHTLATHRKAPKRLYSAAGDGYFESSDYGESWIRPMKGLRHGYLVGFAVDSGNPDAVILSASNGHSLLATLKHLFTEKMKIARIRRLFQMVFLNRVEPRFRSWHQIKRFQESFMPSTIVVSLSQQILAIRGGTLKFNGQENIFYKLLGLLQLANSRIKQVRSQRVPLGH